MSGGIPPANTLGIIAGSGTLPGRVAQAAVAGGRPVYIAGVEGFAEAAVLRPFPHGMFRMGAAGAVLATFRQHGVRDIVMVGQMRRPSLLSLRPDADGAKLLGRVGRAAFAGDDGLLAAVVRVLQEEGFNVLGAHEILREALAPVGLLTRTRPDAQALADISRGIAVTRALGAADVGQGCVVQQGLVLAVEAIEGTDAMLLRARDLARDGVGGVLVKLVKPGQDRRVDLPTIGARTVANAAAAGLRGIAFEAGGTMLADRAALVEAADGRTIFLLGLSPEQIASGTIT